MLFNSKIYVFTANIMTVSEHCNAVATFGSNELPTSSKVIWSGNEIAETNEEITYRRLLLRHAMARHRSASNKSQYWRRYQPCSNLTS